MAAEPSDRSAAEPTGAERADLVVARLAEAGVLSDSARPRQITQLEGGWSRETHLLTVDAGDGAERELVVRVKVPGALLDTSLRQEFETCRLAADNGIAAPYPHVFEDAEDNPFGGPFYVMDRVAGSSPNTWRRRDREVLEENWREEGGTLAEDLVDSLARIHAIPSERAAEVLPGRDLEAAALHWRAIQEEMALARDPVVEDAYEWVLGRQGGGPERQALVHGDYRIGNCLVDGGRISAILDWELAFLGDPDWDLGYVSLAYHAGKFTAPGSSLLNSLAEREWFFGEYERRSGRTVDPESVRTYSVLGILMLVAILNTGVRMYADGRTADVRMAWNRLAIPGLRQDLAVLMDY